MWEVEDEGEELPFCERRGEMRERDRENEGGATLVSRYF